MTVNDCKKNCNRAAIKRAGFCTKVFKSLKYQTTCLVAVNEILAGCYWCCEGNGFYERCIRPYEFIQQYIQAPCDPYWD